MTNEIALTQRALELAMLISQETTTDAWFEYSGHTNTVMVYYAPNGWNRDKADGNSVYITISSRATVKVLQYIVDCFEFIYAIAERKNV